MRRRVSVLFLIAALSMAGLASATPPPALESGPGPGPDSPPAATGPSTFPGLPADAPTTPPPYTKPLREETRRILESSEFRKHKTVRRPVARPWLRKLLTRKTAPPRNSTPPWNLALMAKVFQWLAVTALALGLAWLLWIGWKWLAARQGGRRQRGDGRLPLMVDVQALAAAPLPATISSAARAAWAAGDATRALSLLYRGAVRELAQRHRILLPESATEGECLRQARQSGKAVVTSGFAPIVQAWMALAYARRLPADFEALLTLYRQHFETGPEAAP